MSFYNVFYTVLPPLALGILDQFISARLLDRYPQLYTMGQQNYFFKLKVFAQWIGNAMYHSLILYVGAQLYWYADMPQGDGKVPGHWLWGTALYGAVLLTVLGKAALVTNNWTKYHVLAIPGSMAIWYIFIAVYGLVAPMANLSMEYHGVVPRLFTDPLFWLQTINLAVLCLLRDFTWKYFKRMYKPQTYHHIQEIQKYNIQDYRPRYVWIGINVTQWKLMTCLEWNNSKKLFEKSDRYNACASNEDTLSRRPTRVKRVCSKHTTRRNIVDAMEKWKAQDRRQGNQASLAGGCLRLG